MSRIGSEPISIPVGTDIRIEENTIMVSGPKGQAHVAIAAKIFVQLADGLITVGRRDNSIEAKSLHGTVRARLANAVVGVSRGWQKSLELVGVGYRAKVSGKDLVLNVGYSHPVHIFASADISFTVSENTITVTGSDKEKVGEIAASIRRVRQPEPYQGKGIRYLGEQIRKKAGKATKAVGAAAGK